MEPSCKKSSRTVFRCVAAVVSLLTVLLVFTLVYSVALSVKWNNFSKELCDTLEIPEKGAEPVCSLYSSRKSAKVSEEDIKTVCTIISKGKVQGTNKPRKISEKLSVKFRNGEVLDVYGAEKNTAYIEYDGADKDYRFLIDIGADFDDILKTLRNKRTNRLVVPDIQLETENSVK